MRKLVSIMFSFLFLIVICGCESNNNESEIVFEQKMTIIINETQKSKTINNITNVEEMINILSNAQKLETINSWIGTCEYKIIISVDGQNLIYMFGGKTFCDADGTLYKIKNPQEIKDKINKLYNKLDVSEVDYS